MKRLYLLLLLIVVPAAAWAQALPNAPQPGSADDASWSHVEGLNRGDQIMVSRPGGGFSTPCRFAGATDGMLFCDAVYGDPEYKFPRADITKIRRDDKRRNMRIVIGSFAAAGFIAGVAVPPQAGPPRIVNGMIGAGVGAFGGLLVSLPVALLVPGRLVYRHSH